jgi:hypothetical protein
VSGRFKLWGSSRHEVFGGAQTSAKGVQVGQKLLGGGKCYLTAHSRQMAVSISCEAADLDKPKARLCEPWG